MKRREFQVGEQALAINSAADRAYRVVTVVAGKKQRRAHRLSDNTWHRIVSYKVQVDDRTYIIPSRWLMPLDPLLDDVLVERDAKSVGLDSSRAGRCRPPNWTAMRRRLGSCSSE